MTPATKARLTFEDYLEISSRSEERYELVQGELIEVNPPSKIHYRIAKFLERLFDAEIEQCGYPWEAFRELGQRTESSSSRLPDVAVVRSEDFEALPEDKSAVLQVPSILLVEIVSPSNPDQDYGTKRREYEALRVPEYWIVNALPKQDQRVTVYILKGGSYQQQDYRGNQ